MLHASRATATYPQPEQPKRPLDVVEQGGRGKRRRVEPAEPKLQQATAQLLEAGPRTPLEQGTLPAHAPTPQQQIAKQRAEANLARLDQRNSAFQNDKNLPRGNKNSRRRNGVSDEST